LKQESLHCRNFHGTITFGREAEVRSRSGHLPQLISNLMAKKKAKCIGFLGLLVSPYLNIRTG